MHKTMSLPEEDCAVKIAVRQRPLREIYQNSEIASSISYHSSNSNILIADERPFAFDHVLPPNVSQKELFDSLVLPLVSKVLEGFNCTALAYGQTGTGKSFTMGLNPESFKGEEMGLIPRCLQEILKQKYDDPHFKYEILGSFIEIYSEKVYDILGENPAEPIIARGYKFTGGTRKPIENIHDAYALLIQGTKNRHVRPTKMNAQSSRSHAIFTIHVQSNATNRTTQSCLNLVDLAGSEGVRRTGHQGLALSEGVHINQGLLSIGKVLQAITHGYKVIPYRDSVLSSVLQDSLNPNSYFTLLACISPHREDLSETLSTLRFAQTAKNLKHNPQLNSKLMELKKAKTPFKMLQSSTKRTSATPTPYRRPLSLANPKQSSGTKKITVHGNTFCTPGKKEKRANTKFNQSDVGLTPKEKQKIGSVRMPISKVAPFSFGPPERESLNYRYNDTSLESRPSLLSLNISSSTAIESQPATSSKTFSPIVRRCMAEMESTMKSSMLRVLESIKNTNTTSVTVQDNCPSALVERNLRNIIRQELLTITRENNVNDHRVADNGVRCELFRSSSPIFKMPEIPGVRPMPDFSTSQISISSQNGSILNGEATVLPKPLRRSLRVTSRANSICDDDSMVMPRRRSIRISSITEHNKNKRRSIRLAAHKEEPQEENRKRSKPTKRTKPTKVSALVNNSTIAGYFDEEKEKTHKSTKDALAKHQKAILKMLNDASMKELQLLPQIGLKTAFQIVTQRTLHGKFKNFTQVSKLPIWRGQAWERFKMVIRNTSRMLRGTIRAFLIPGKQHNIMNSLQDHYHHLCKNVH